MAVWLSRKEFVSLDQRSCATASPVSIGKRLGVEPACQFYSAWPSSEGRRNEYQRKLRTSLAHRARDALPVSVVLQCGLVPS